MLRATKMLSIALLGALGLLAGAVTPAAAQTNVLPGPVADRATVVSPRPAAPTADPYFERLYTPQQGKVSLANKFSEVPVNVPPIFMTQINYAGVYGAYYYGAAPAPEIRGVSATPYTLRPTWTTLPPGLPNIPPTGTPPPPPATGLPAIPPPEERGSAATISIYAPEGGSVWVQGQALPATDGVYRFVTPPLRPNQLYNYEVRAAWSEDGRPVTDYKDVVLQSGEAHVIGFHRKSEALPLSPGRIRD
jgi:uncharacterized protein (TIGR03000 family)